MTERLPRLPFALALGTCLTLLAAACGGGSPSEPTRPGPILGDRNAEVIVVGDIGWCGSTAPAATAQLVDRLSGLLLLAGDIAYPNGSAADFQNCFHPTWGRFRDRWYATAGNHDYLTPNAAGFFNYFGEAAGSDRTGYFAILVGDWQVLMLNSNIPAQRNTPQWEFVRREIDLQRRPCTLAVWHHPLFTSGQNGPNTSMRDLYSLLEAGGADVVVNAHDHVYERFAKQAADGRPADRGSASSSPEPAVPNCIASSRSRRIPKRASRSSACCGCCSSPPLTAGSSSACRAAWPTRATSPATNPTVHLVWVTVSPDFPSFASIPSSQQAEGRSTQVSRAG